MIIVGSADADSSSGCRFPLLLPAWKDPSRRIHVEHGDKVPKFWLDPINLAESYGFRALVR